MSLKSLKFITIEIGYFRHQYCGNVGFNIADLKEKLGAANPRGYTPLAYTLEQTPKDFSVEAEAQKVVIVLSDGEETCGGDPAAVVKKLKAEGFNVVVHTVGFDVDAKTRAQLESIARAGGGEYYDAKDSVQLVRALDEATRRAVIKDKKKTVEGTPIKGGDDFDTAVPLPPDTLFRLDHHQKEGNYDYFTVELKKGQQVKLVARTLELGLDVYRNGEASENDRPYSSVKLVSPERDTIREVSLFGRKFGAKEEFVSVRREGLFFILVGGYNQHKDGALFHYSIISNGDLGGPTDAGDTWESALSITPQRYTSNYAGTNDEQDSFKFLAKKGERYRLGIIPGGEFSGRFSYSVKDDFKQSIISERAKDGEGFKGQPFEIPEDGEYLVQISLVMYRSGDNLLDYTFELKKLEGEAPAEGEVAQ